MSYYETNPPWVMGASLHTVTGMGSSLHTVFGMGSPPNGGSVIFAPSDLTGLVVWLDATKITGLSSGASLSVWTDQSGSGHHLTQTSATTQPVFLTPDQNGLSVVSAIGVAGAARSFMTVAFTQAQPETVALAFSLSSTVANQQDVIDGFAGGTMVIGPVTAARLQAFPGSTVVDSLLSLSVGSWYAAGAIFNGSNSTLFVGSTISKGGTGNSASSGLAVFGRTANSQFAHAKIGELVYYNRALTSTELSQLTTYLKSKWSTDL